MSKEDQLKEWAKDDDIDLMTMYEMCFDKGWSKDCVLDQESIRKYICDKVSRGISVADTLKVIEKNVDADIFKFNKFTGLISKPIYTKEELIRAIIGK